MLHNAGFCNACPLSRTELTLDIASLPLCSDGDVSATGIVSFRRPCDKPGSPLLPLPKLSLDEPSSWLFLYAALPNPLSEVWRNQDGSRDPSEAAICSRESSRSSAAALLPCELFSTAAIDSGLTPPALDAGRRCHVSVPDRARLDALGGGCNVDGVNVEGCAGFWMVGVLILFLSAEPKPLNSGISSTPEVDC